MKMSPIPNTLHMPENRGPSSRGNAATATGNAAGQSVAAANVGRSADIIDTSTSPAKMAAATIADLGGVSEYRNFGALVSKFARGELSLASAAADGVEGPEAGDPTSGPTNEETGGTGETNPVTGDDVAASDGDGAESGDAGTADTDPVVAPEANTEEDLVSESDPVVEPGANTEEDMVAESDGEETTLTDIAEDVVVGDLEAALIDELLEDGTEAV
ncbi:MAG: hypothetical protein IIC52_06030 [Proteobacteria bacterium]|nr:hypothetical protein [Pseudomonadota bacterium]